MEIIQYLISLILSYDTFVRIRILPHPKISHSPKLKAVPRCLIYEFLHRFWTVFKHHITCLPYNLQMWTRKSMETNISVVRILRSHHSKHCLEKCPLSDSYLLS